MNNIPTAVPKALEMYLFCSPAMDGSFRCLPRAGGYYDQYWCDIVRFAIIERRIIDVKRRKKESKPKKNE